MSLRSLVAAGALAGLIALPALADVVSPGPDGVAVTIYRDRPGAMRQITAPGAVAGGLALITETRTVDVPAGQSRIEFRGVADGIVPETAKIDGLPADVVEYNFDYELLSPGSLISRSIGRHVRLVRTQPRTGKVTEEDAVLRSGPDGVMLETGGKLEALQCSGWPEKLVFDQIPAGLRDKPTLSLVTRAAAPGRYAVKLSYLATGFDWSADYVARISPGGRTLDLSGWITLVNTGDIGFPDAPTAVVAGRWNRVADDGIDRERPEPIQATPSCWPLDIDWATHRRAVALNGYPALAMPAPSPPMMASVNEVVVTGARRATMTELGDYKLYSLPEPTTVAAHQAKQVQLLDQADVPFERVYGYQFRLDDDADSDPDAARPATVLLRLQNKPEARLGKPLPAGIISVMEPDGRGRMVLAGEKRLDDMPVGLPLDIELGRALDVRVRPRVVSRIRTGSGDHRRERIAVEAVIANDKPTPIAFEFRHPEPGVSFQVIAESDRHALKSGGPIWTFVLAPAERRVLSYTFEQAQ